MDLVLGVVWLGLLWYVAAAFGRQQSAVDRIRTSLLLGIAIPGVLAITHLLYPLTLWLSMLALVMFRIRCAPKIEYEYDGGLFITIGATFIILWPPLSRPLLDGDSLAYHLPNAMAWVQQHSIWTASAPYWYYPPASELFAAGLLAADARWSLPLAGAAAAVLLAGRIYIFARGANAPVYAAIAVTLALMFTPIVAFESGTLQNDVWIAAFFVEILAASTGTIGSVVACSLLKPFGFIEAAIAVVAAQKPFKAYVIAIAALAAWLARDLVLLWHGPFVPPSSLPNYWFTTIAGSLAGALPQLAHALARTAPQYFVWLAFLLAGLTSPKTRNLAFAGAAACLVYIFLPLSYRSLAMNYVIDGSSARFMLPAIATGALIAAVWAGAMPIPAAMFCTILAATGAIAVLNVFWNDTLTHRAPLIALLAVAAAAVGRQTRGVSIVLVFAAIALVGAHDAQARAVAFYNDWMRTTSGTATGVFSWLSHERPARIIVQNVRSGAILMVSPATNTTEVDAGIDACGLARQEHALLLVGSNEDRSPEQLAARFTRARQCGSVVFQDAAAVIVRPIPATLQP